MPLSKNPKVKSIHTHQFDPFLEISHRCKLTVHFNKIPTLNIEPVVLEFPIIITDYPSVVSDSVLSLASSTHNVISTETFHQPTAITNGGGDDAVPVDLDLPEYTPRYEEASSSTSANTPPPIVTN